MRRLALCRIGAACAIVVLSGCGRDSTDGGRGGSLDPPRSTANPRVSLRETPPPVTLGVEPSLHERIRASYASLMAAQQQRRGGPSVSPAQSTDVDLGRAYGQVGKLLLAAELYDQAEPYLLNAAALDSGELAWPYFLAHTYRLKFQADQAITRLEDVLRREPGHVPSLVWLGTMHIDRGRADLAEPLLTKAVSLDPRSAAARFELGKAALAAGDSARAVTELEAALAADPGADGVHYALAMAYRARGDAQRAAAHVKLWRDERLYPDDPLMAEITDLLKTAVVYEIRGTRAMDDRKWSEAAALFREGLKIAPRDATLHQNLGTALYLAGDPRAAEAEFETAARLLPGYAKALFSLGVLLEERGQDQDAINRFSAAVASDPTMVTARSSLADALRRSGKLDAAITEYVEIVKLDPSASQARFGHAMALVRLRRFAEARAVLEEAARTHPEQPGLAHALARLLAAAPDDAVRDGSRALVIVQSLEKTAAPSVALVETAAMALAENGRFAEAVARQRQAIAMSTQARRNDLAARLTQHLRRYESSMPSRTPWSDDDPVHFPRASSGR
jgi:tetratricopeptide (TPR) repeat protein